MKKARLLTFIKVSRTCPTKNTKDCKVLILLLFLISDGAEGVKIHQNIKVAISDNLFLMHNTNHQQFNYIGSSSNTLES